MKRMLRYILSLAVFLLAANSWAGFTDFTGAPHKLSDFTGKGKWTIVMFWASDCRVCNAEIGQYIRFNDKHKNQDASILGVSLDGQSGIKAAQGFVQRHAVTFPNLVAEPEAIVSLYQNLTGNDWVGTPSFLVYSPDGKLQAAQAGAVPPALIEKFIKENTQPANKP